MVTPEAAFFQEEGTHFFHAGLIQAVEGLVQEQKLRLFHHGLGDAQTLPHTHGVFPHMLPAFGVQADSSIAAATCSLEMVRRIWARSHRFWNPE